MGKNKLQRFAENETFPHLFQHHDYEARTTPFLMKGNWNKDFFKNDHPIIIELGCGKGEYTVGMAQRHPHNNYIGVDRKGARLWRGCKDIAEQQIPNAAFIRTKIDDIEFYFAPEEVAEIWVTFPDPQVRKERKRLISPNFTGKYRKILKKDGVIHLKTDSRELYDYVLEAQEYGLWKVEEQIYDVYESGETSILTEIQTFYEKMWLKEGKAISYLRIKLLEEKKETL